MKMLHQWSLTTKIHMAQRWALFCSPTCKIDNHNFGEMLLPKRFIDSAAGAKSTPNPTGTSALQTANNAPPNKTKWPTTETIWWRGQTIPATRNAPNTFNPTLPPTKSWLNKSCRLILLLTNSPGQLLRQSVNFAHNRYFTWRYGCTIVDLDELPNTSNAIRFLGAHVPLLE